MVCLVTNINHFWDCNYFALPTTAGKNVMAIANMFPVLVIWVVHRHCTIRTDDDQRNLRHEYEHTSSLIIPNSDHSLAWTRGLCVLTIE